MDIIGVEDDFSKYKLLIAPMLYLVSEEAGARIERFVENGGTFVATYWSGIVDENDLCHLGGFPGPLRRTLGIWSEETEGLHPHDSNSLHFLGDNLLGLSGEYEIRDLCEITHAEGAEVLAVYKSDFYAGSPALTVHSLGLGKAYHLAARVMDQLFYEVFYGKLASEAGVRRVMDSELPRGVTAQMRSNGANEYVFIMNFSGLVQMVVLDSSSYKNLETGAEVSSRIELPLNGIIILKRNAWLLRP